ncbi:cytochrome c oxidase assembly protein, putative [Hepatocystis sp. ex Piliocolobus tephrosceles]|nr:cytochrome c oxidase assembly protein, putative [Hepatocystis sp. ex Piliocolobus tephrosceles]
MNLNKFTFHNYYFRKYLLGHRFSENVFRIKRRFNNTFTKLSSSEESYIIKKAKKYTEYVKEGYEFKVGIWLSTCSLLVLGMVTIGGYTRLTESGLSITHWKLNGVRYPRDEEEWITEFNKYKNTPEYKEVHYGMSLDEYKTIFFNEWLHRTVGRAVGLFFIGGSAFFLYKKALKKHMIKHLSAFFTLGAFQGFVGWWMVKSGFEKLDTENKTPRVSPYRLVFHLFCATVTYSYLFFTSLTLIDLGKLRRQFYRSQINEWQEFLRTQLIHTLYEKRHVTLRMKFGLFTFGCLILSNILYGGFVAGNDAGYAYNTWPKMLDKYIPDEVIKFCTDKKKNYKQLFENTAIIQFNHRLLGYFIFLESLLLHYYSKKLLLSKKTKRFFAILPLITTTQLLTGIYALVHTIPIHMALVHQFGGFCMLSTLLHLVKFTFK